jgi:hypothetical protein
LEHAYLSDPVLAGALLYWRGKRGRRELPRRSDIDPTEIGKLLPHLQLIEVVGGGARYRYRLVGTSLVTAFGREYTGKYLDELFTGDRLANAKRVYGMACSRRKPVFLRNRYSSMRDLEMVANRLYMPLSDDGAAVNMILGALTFEWGRSGAVAGLWSDAQLAGAEGQLEIVEDEPIPA